MERWNDEREESDGGNENTKGEREREKEGKDFYTLYRKIRTVLVHIHARVYNFWGSSKKSNILSERLDTIAESCEDAVRIRSYFIANE